MSTLRVAVLILISWSFLPGMWENSFIRAKSTSLAVIQKSDHKKSLTTADVGDSQLLSNYSPAEKSLDLKGIVEEMNRKQIEAFMRGDLQAVAHFYADNATIYFPDYKTQQARRIRGRAAIDKYWLGFGVPKAWKLEVAEVGGTTDAIWVIGTSTLTEEYDSKDHTYVGDFVVIWKRQRDGGYKIYTDIYT